MLRPRPQAQLLHEEGDEGLDLAQGCMQRRQDKDPHRNHGASARHNKQSQNNNQMADVDEDMVPLTSGGQVRCAEVTPPQNLLEGMAQGPRLSEPAPRVL